MAFRFLEMILDSDTNPTAYYTPQNSKYADRGGPQKLTQCRNRPNVHCSCHFAFNTPMAVSNTPMGV